LPPICHEKGKGISHGATGNIDRLGVQKGIGVKRLTL
jgi:hypothetical protein